MEKDYNFNLACTEIANLLVTMHKSKKNINIHALQTKISKKYTLTKMPTLVDILAAFPPSQRHLTSIFKGKPIRTASGVAVVAVMCKPHRCPHIALTGNICVYCPGGPDSDFEYSTQSYTGYEPTSMRAIRHRYDPYEQARTRILQLQSLGHPTDKVEFIIMGGTFMSLSDAYKEGFVSALHDSLSGSRSLSLTEAIARSEMSKNKCVGITIETRPDFCKPMHLSKMLSYGCTRIEIGVQSVYEDVAYDTNRGHTVASVCETLSLSKDAGYKIVAHMMPNLPNVDMKRDYSQFLQYFEDPNFRSDGLKIYPTLVIRGTGLYELWKNKRYRNYSPDELIDFLSRILSLVPAWTRIYRVQRDIPMPLVSSGVEHGNIREIVLARMKDLNTKCRDIRTREVGVKNIHEDIEPDSIELVRREYAANDGWETFLSYEDVEKDILIGMLRLRKCSINTFREELCDKQEKGEPTMQEIVLSDSKGVNDKEESITIEERERKKGFRITRNPICNNDNASVIRELHVYGSSVPIHYNDGKKYQHQGIGSFLIQKAEKIAKYEHKSKKIAIISGVGTRDYYKKFGYHLEGPYMVKNL